MLNRSRAFTALTAIAAVLSIPQVAHATDGYFVNGMGAKAKGAGGVAIAMAEDAVAIAANPAAAVELGNRFDIGFEVFVPKRGAEVSKSAAFDGEWSGNGANPFILPELAYVRQLNDTFAAGIVINGNGGMNTKYERNPFGPDAGFGPAGVNLRQIFITPTLAARLGEGHSIGVSPILMLQSFSMTGIQPFTQFPGLSAAPTKMTNQGDDWSTGAGLRVGYLGQLGPAVKFGAFYQTKVWAKPFESYAGLFANGGDFDVPASWGGGISVKATDKLTLGADYKRIEYSGVASVGNPLAFDLPFGADGGPGFGWQDIDVVKFGAVYQANDKLTLRVGYGRSDNPVPGSQAFLNLLAPGVVTDHFTAGATVKLNSKLELSGYVMHAPRNDVRGIGAIPADFGGGDVNIHLAETATGLSLGFVF